MADPFVAEIRIFPFNFAPKGWAFCNGQLLPLSQNTALFSLLGTTYGGDGKSNFALPNMQGSAPMAPGQGSGLTQRYLGESDGSNTVTLLMSEIPNHNHTFNCLTTDGTTAASSNNQLGRAFKGSLQGSVSVNMYSTNQPNTNMAPSELAVTGGNQPHNNMMPYLTLNFCIAMQGVYPPRT
jgi:microcystin-dependent protein